MSLIAELKRRNVFRVGVAYAIVGWLLVEVSSVLLPAFKVPEWVFQAFVILVVLGFPPPVLVMRWSAPSLLDRYARRSTPFNLVNSASFHRLFT
jgi:hypothetical protein